MFGLDKNKFFDKKDNLSLKNNELVNVIDKYFEETVRKMVGAPHFNLDLADILENLGFNIDECNLTSIPICYQNNTIWKKSPDGMIRFGTYGCLTEYTINSCYKEYQEKLDEGLGLFFDYLINNHYTNNSFISDIFDDRYEENKFDFVGAIQINFINNNIRYRILIDMYTGYVVLYDGESIKVYGMNRRLLGNLANSYREMGLNKIPEMFLMAIYGKNPYDLSIIDSEYDVYCSNNPSSRLDKTTFKRLFKGKVVREK